MKKRDIGKEILEGIREMKKGKAGRRNTIDVPVEIKSIRGEMDLSQSEFAELIGVSKRTLQEWEQGRCKPAGAAVKLLLVAKRHPKALLT
jgi:putative transcriptional regulator